MDWALVWVDYGAYTCLASYCLLCTDYDLFLFPCRLAPAKVHTDPIYQHIQIYLFWYQL